jgi:radical SAM superfamily enzyme YgiQ (UPF0313 family)
MKIPGDKAGIEPWKVLLCIPPDYDHGFPPLGTPALCGYLKAKGIPAEQTDLNIQYREFLINKIRISHPKEISARMLLKPLLWKFFAEKLKGRYYSRFLQRVKDPSQPFLPYRNNTNSSFSFTERMLSSACLWRYLSDAKENTFLQFYESSGLLERLATDGIPLFGISVTSPSQALPALTLGLLIKSRRPRIHVTLGGQWVTLFRRQIMARPDLARAFDSLVLFDGETPLHRLALRLRDGGHLPITNVFFAGSPRNFCEEPHGEDLNALPCPDFDGLPLAAYDGNSPRNMNLTYETSRGCYWSRCAYCVDVPLPRPAYRAKKADLVVKDIVELVRKYDARHLLLGDPGMSPRQMRAVAKAIIARRVKITWWCMARLDAGFTPEIFALAAKAGLQRINFGFESASDRVCDSLNKGNRRQRSAAVIQACAQAGIAVDLQTMLGLPGETYAEGLETISFLIEHRKSIHNATFNVYYLTPANDVHAHPHRYGIAYALETLPFRFFVPFRNEKGMSSNEAALLQKTYHSLLEQNVRPPKRPRPSPRDIRVKAELSLNGETSRISFLVREKK